MKENAQLPAFTNFLSKKRVTFWSLVSYQNACGSNQKMWNSNLHYNLLRQAPGKYEDSEESQVSSQGKESSQ